MTKPKKALPSWEEELAEYGFLHNEDCCVNFEDSRACDVGIGIVDCCENIKIMAHIVRKEKEKSKKEENKRWIKMAEAHRPLCSSAGNKMLTKMMGKTNRNRDLIKEARRQAVKKVIDYISSNQGWEETGDIYRKHFGLKEIYKK